MKRHQVMDLFHGNQKEDLDGVWHKINPAYSNTFPQTSSKGIKVKAKLDNNIETFAYFYPDKGGEVGQYSSYFWDCTDKLPLSHVTHFKYLKE